MLALRKVRKYFMLTPECVKLSRFSPKFPKYCGRGHVLRTPRGLLAMRGMPNLSLWERLNLGVLTLFSEEAYIFFFLSIFIQDNSTQHSQRLELKLRPDAFLHDRLQA